MQTLLIITGLAALTCAGLLLLVLRRIDRVQADVGRLSQLDALSEQVASLAAQVERREFSVALQAKLTEFAEAQARLTAAVAELQESTSSASVRAARVRAPAADLLGSVREHLLAQAFESVHLLTDVSALKDGSGRVTFEARRDGVLHKGHAVLEAGRIVGDSVVAAWSAFP